MAELKKDGIRAVMSEGVERETLKSMAQQPTTTKEALEPCPLPEPLRSLAVEACNLCLTGISARYTYQERKAVKVTPAHRSITERIGSTPWVHGHFGIAYDCDAWLLHELNSRASAPIAPVVDEKDDAFIFRHGADCDWERTTSAECEYKDTHNYCPHPEHACSCPQISGDNLSDNPTLEEAEAYLRANGVTLEDVANAFIERLLQNNLRLKQEAAALRDRAGPRRCVKCNHDDTCPGRDGRCRAIVLGPDAMQGSGMAHCGCQCESIAATPPSTLARKAAEEIVGTVFDNTAASPETLKQAMLERVEQYFAERCFSAGGEKA